MPLPLLDSLFIWVYVIIYILFQYQCYPIVLDPLSQIQILLRTVQLLMEIQYHNIHLEQTETWNALIRRIHKVRIYTAPGEWQEYDTTDYLHGFQPVDRADRPFNN